MGLLMDNTGTCSYITPLTCSRRIRTHHKRVLTVQIFYKIFKEKCVLPGGKRSLFADVGSNFGWFAILAGMMGCK